jgi:YD repeat-containing protein
MKNIITQSIIVLGIVLVLAACTKEKNITPEKPVKQYFIIKSTSGTSITRYNRDNNGRLTSIIAEDGKATKDSITLGYDSRGNIASYNWMLYSAPSRNEYTYDASGKLVERKGYAKDGSSAISTFAYFEDRVEHTINYSNGTNVNIYYYTPDKKNIASMKVIGTSGKVAEEQVYTYSRAKAIKYGTEKLNGYENENLVEKTVVTTYNNAVPGSTPVTYTNYRKITVNEDNYVTSIEYSASNSTSTSTTVYEYMVK